MEDLKKIDERVPNRKQSREELYKKSKLVPAAKVEQAVQNTEAVSVNISANKKATGSHEQINSILTEINEAVRTTDEITALFEGITGIITQASKTDSMERLKVLEREARDLAVEVSKIANTDVRTSKSADKALIEIETKLQNALGELRQPASSVVETEISFESPDKLSDSSKKIESTKEHLLGLTQTVRETALEIKRAIDIGEIAVANNEASTVMVRDVDAALEIATKTSLSINSDPRKAMAAIGESKRGQELLK